MDGVLGNINEIIEPKDITLYNYIHVEVEKWWDMLNIRLHALAYFLTPKY